MTRLAIVTSRFNDTVTGGLKRGAEAHLAAHGLTADHFPAPGAFEIPLLAKTLAQSGRYDG